MAAFALVPVARRAGAIGKAGRNVMPDRAILKSAASALRDAQSRAGRDGWNDDAIASALSATRVIAAVAAGHRISRKPLPPDGVTPEGRIRVDHGTLRPTATTVSSGVTTPALTGSPRLDRLGSSLAVLTSAMYRRSPQRDGTGLDEAARQVIDVAENVASERNWWSSRWARR
jgi:hypothetical protein